ncbi:glyoxylase-like metal-dependent hydrolase (beta-lactamase superfamily II) [Rhizobium subbaraonis]|uniref:Glyoxylase-like metal-dependent hydrolase (Beta-lactamase superfamily II) n=1 Tax=Rhizobium subbaraonis TaxID=908946 RepID=A0A285UTV2_9HYPH|nr:MBL fold metallo-hydrolase [Rhizobium subbaraonis]SOC45252.1 glyoxylase-like metal-dependent hydrolase (beta-lactamase superfamily II) [Rhizobium subbaraonis]
MLRISADKWYAVSRLDDDVTYICEPHIKEFYRCNIWHVRGRDADMLVDSGMGVVSLREWVPLVTERPLVAVASHTHFDHVGCHHEFECRAVHAAEADLLAQPTRANTLADPYVTDDIFDALPPEPYCSKCYGVKTAPATRILQHGDVIDLGDRHFEVVHTPGHSPGGIALWEKRTGILFSGDILYDGPLIEDTYHSDAADYLASMKRLLDYPVRVVHGGHFPSFDGARYRQLIRDWLDAKRDRPTDQQLR